MIFVLDAWQRGDEKEMHARIGPLEASADQAIASGVDGWWVHIPKAIFCFMRGEKNLALEHLDKAASRSIMPVERMEYMQEVLGWDTMPEFVALAQKHRNYVTTERDKLLAMACGPDGFEVWQPSDDECGRDTTPTAPN